MAAEVLSLVRRRARIHAALGEPARLAIVDLLGWGDRSPGEIAERLELSTNLVAHHLQVLQDAGVITRGRSEGDQRRIYLRLIPDALSDLAPPALAPLGLAPAPRVVFVCTHNSARSQFAAALWARHSQVPVASAGTHPAPRVHPRAVAVGRRHGLALRGVRPVSVDAVLSPLDLVIAVCDEAHEALTWRAGTRLHWSVPDPARADTDAAFESAYADIADRVERITPAFAPREDTP